MIGFEDDPVRKELGWLLESTIWINRGHPAFKRVAAAEAENYHIVLTVAWVLSCYVEAEKSPQSFVNKFLATWGSGL